MLFCIGYSYVIIKKERWNRIMPAVLKIPNAYSRKGCYTLHYPNAINLDTHKAVRSALNPCADPR